MTNIKNSVKQLGGGMWKQKHGLHNSLFSVYVIFENEVVGCGRVIGDGGIYFYIQDVIVLPEFQGKGIGKRIMNAIMDYLKTYAPSGAFVYLMAAKGVSRFYERYERILL